MQVIIVPYFPSRSNADSSFLKQKVVVAPRQLFNRLLNSQAKISLNASPSGAETGAAQEGNEI